MFVQVKPTAKNVGGVFYETQCRCPYRPTAKQCITVYTVWVKQFYPAVFWNFFPNSLNFIKNFYYTL